VKRPAFLAGFVATALAIRARAQDEDYDPAVSTEASSLRVLLGRGDASAVDGRSFLYDGRRYRGTYSRLADGNVLSLVPLEEYLYSVVAREMSPSWPAAALQAQAICARTYVLARTDPKRAYDVVTTEADQVYGGIASESLAATAAVDATAGVVLRYGSAYAQVFYSSSCGGRTESSADAWQGGADLPYLQGVVCPWCTQSPDYDWSRTVDAAALGRAFPGAVIGPGTDLQVSATDASGRALQFALTGDAGAITTRGTTFRSAVGTRVVRSLLIRRIASAQGPGTFVIEGGGLGHGVGLCQWGARGMAAAAHTSDEILDFYFPGTQRGHD